MGRISLVIAVVVLWFSAAQAQYTPEDAVEGHFAEISAENYVSADAFFSEAFRRAFKGEIQRLNEYYMARRTQIDAGYTITDARMLADEDKDTAVVVVDFVDSFADSPFKLTERIYYYLIREDQPEGSPLLYTDGQAWRIDIFDSFEFETLAEARRRPYLYTREAWPDETSRELKSRQGLFRIQWALEAFFEENGYYPLRLHGGDNRRDELIADKHLTGSYPICGFADRPMREVAFGKKSSGDFAYYSFDHDEDGKAEGYWLLLHGKIREHFYYAGRDITYILASWDAYSQADLAQDFALFWLYRDGEELEITAAVEPLTPRGGLVPATESTAQQPPVAEEAEITVTLGEPVSETEVIEPVPPGVPESAGAIDSTPVTMQMQAASRALAAWRSMVAQAAAINAKQLVGLEPPKAPEIIPEALEPLFVYSYGF